MYKKVLSIFLILFSLFFLASCDNVKYEFQEEAESGAKVTTFTPYSNDILRGARHSSVALNVVVRSGLMLSGGSGSGTIIRASDATYNNGVSFDLPTTDLTLYILTNYHVIQPIVLAKTENIVSKDIVFNNNDLTLTSAFDVVKFNAALDLAVVKTTVNGSSLVTGRKLRVQNILEENYNKRVVNEGLLTFACGSPLGTSNSTKITRGVVSRITESHYVSDTPINPGNSGGGLYDAFTGKFIGVTSAGIVEQIDKSFTKQQAGLSIRFDIVIQILKSFAIEF